MIPKQLANVSSFLSASSIGYSENVRNICQSFISHLMTSICLITPLERGENFVLAGITVDVDERIIFIDTDAGFRLLAKSTLWYVGTGLVLHCQV